MPKKKTTIQDALLELHKHDFDFVTVSDKLDIPSDLLREWHQDFGDEVYSGIRPGHEDQTPESETGETVLDPVIRKMVSRDKKGASLITKNDISSQLEKIEKALSSETIKDDTSIDQVNQDISIKMLKVKYQALKKLEDSMDVMTVDQITRVIEVLNKAEIYSESSGNKPKTNSFTRLVQNVQNNITINNA